MNFCNKEYYAKKFIHADSNLCKIDRQTKLKVHGLNFVIGCIHL